MTFEQKRAKVRHHLEAAIRLQRESWDEALAIQELTANYERDFYALVAELAGGFKDNEAITIWNAQESRASRTASSNALASPSGGFRWL